jgi:hypothetical protein
MSDMQLDKSSGTSVSPYFNQTRHGGVNTGVISADRGNGQAGGEVRREEIFRNGGSMLRSPKVADSVRR